VLCEQIELGKAPYLTGGLTVTLLGSIDKRKICGGNGRKRGALFPCGRNTARESERLLSGGEREIENRWVVQWQIREIENRWVVQWQIKLKGNASRTAVEAILEIFFYVIRTI
jgi:hypothetical protein